jgi:hypothetical protein
VHIAGEFQSMMQGGSLEGDGSPMPVDTMGEQFAGITPVPKHMKLTFDTFVPPTGFQLDVFKLWASHTKVTFRLQFAGGGQQVTVEGYFDVPSLKFGTSDHTMLSCSALVSYADWS